MNGIRQYGMSNFESEKLDRNVILESIFTKDNIKKVLL